MGNSKARISERITKPNKKPRRKDGPQHQHLLSFQHEERLGRFLLQQQMEQRLDGLQQEPRQPVQVVQELVQQGGGQGGGGQCQDGGQDRRLRVQAGGVEGLRAIRNFSWKEGTRRRRRTVAATSRGAPQGGTPCPRRRKLSRWFPISPLRESLSSPHPRVPLLLQMRPMKQSEILSFI